MIHIPQSHTDTLAPESMDSASSGGILVSATDSLGDVHTAYPSLFSSTSAPASLEGKPLNVYNQPFWVPGLLIAGFIMLAWVRLFFRRRLNMIVHAVFAKNIANQLLREGNLFNERTGLILFGNYLIVMAMMAFQSMLLFNIEVSIRPWQLYALLVAGLLGLWLLKMIMVRGLSVLFKTSAHSKSLLANMLLYNLFAGILLLPVVSCMAYAHSGGFFYIGLAIVLLLYFMRLMREAAIGFKIIKFSVFHLILYLCSLEILPLIVLAKILTRNMTL